MLLETFKREAHHILDLGIGLSVGPVTLLELNPGRSARSPKQ